MTSTSTGRSTKKKFHLIAPEVARLAGQGKSRGAIARELHVAPSTVSRAAEEAGVTFDREVTAEATETARTQARDRRVILTDYLYSAAGKSIRRLHAALDANEPGDSKSWATVTGIVVDKITRLEPDLDPQAESMEDGKQALGELMAAIRTNAAHRRNTPDD